MTLEHLDTTQTLEKDAVQEETPEVEGAQPPEPPKNQWWRPVLAAVAVLAGLSAALLFATCPAPLPDPHEGLSAALSGLSPLESPACVGVLGQAKLGSLRFGVSGDLNLQADDRGLALATEDFTVGYEEGSADIGVYINRDMAAAKLPDLTGETWYGVDLLKGLKEQAIEVAGEELVEWYFGEGQLEEAGAAMDDLRVQLGNVHEIGLGSADAMRLQTFFRDLSGETLRTETGYDLRFTADAPQINTLLDPTGQIKLFTTQSELSQTVDVTVHIDEQQRLLGADVTCDSFTLLFDLGDPVEPTPRLELTQGGLELELAFTLSEGGALTAPNYTNAFDLLNLLAAGE